MTGGPPHGRLPPGSSRRRIGCQARVNRARHHTVLPRSDPAISHHEPYQSDLAHRQGWGAIQDHPLVIPNEGDTTEMGGLGWDAEIVRSQGKAEIEMASERSKVTKIRHETLESPIAGAEGQTPGKTGTSPSELW